MNTSLYEPTPEKSPLLTSYQQFIALQTVVVPLVITSFFGMVTNSLNIYTFIKIGLNDSVTVSFFCLSLADFFVVSTSAITAFTIEAYILERAGYVYFLVDTRGVIALEVGIREYFYVISSFVTTFLAIVRCLCVAWPLRFREIITQTRTFIVISVFVIIALALHLPYFIGITFVETCLHVVNNTCRRRRIQRVVTDVFVIAGVLIETVNDLAFNFLTEIVVFVCLFILVRNLRQSSRFRESATSKNGQLQADSTSGKDVTVIKQVALVSVIFLIGNLPRMTVALAIWTVPEFASTGGKLYASMFELVDTIRYLFEAAGCSCNLVIYWKFNSKFRQTLGQQLVQQAHDG